MTNLFAYWQCVDGKNAYLTKRCVTTENVKLKTGSELKLHLSHAMNLNRYKVSDSRVEKMFRSEGVISRLLFEIMVN